MEKQIGISDKDIRTVLKKLQRDLSGACGTSLVLDAEPPTSLDPHTPTWERMFYLVEVTRRKLFGLIPWSTKRVLISITWGEAGGGAFRILCCVHDKRIPVAPVEKAFSVFTGRNVSYQVVSVN